MRTKLNIFTKMVLLLLMILIPIVCLYAYSNRVSTHVVKSNLTASNLNQLLFFQNQLDASINRLSLFPNMLIQDPDILSLQEIYLNSPILDLDAITVIKRIESKLIIQSNSTNWSNQLFVYSPSIRQVVSTNSSAAYNESIEKSPLKPGWIEAPTGGSDQPPDFSWFTVAPYSAWSHPKDAKLIIEVKFNGANISQMLDKFKEGGRSDPFFFKAGQGVIFNHTADSPVIRKLAEQLSAESLPDIDSRTLRVDRQNYLVNMVRSHELGWYLIDYIPLEQILSPIHRSNQWFYLSIAFLLLMSCIAAYLLYVQVQVPIKALMKSFQRLMKEDYAYRIQRKGSHEFGFLFERFNLMASRLEELIQTVYLEKIHLREAKLKQLQSQINPHFFYNCFSFISSMAKLKDMDSVVSMTQNLATYYRYTTRQEMNLVPLEKEIRFITSYLEIQRMRMPRLHYSMEIPDDLGKALIPPLTIQPLIENAVIHGIEPNSDAGVIRIVGGSTDEGYFLTVEDNGGGMTPEEVARLQQTLTKPMTDEMGCGLWNVNQRLMLHYGARSGITFERSPLGGLLVALRWSFQAVSENAEGADII